MALRPYSHQEWWEGDTQVEWGWVTPTGLGARGRPQISLRGHPISTGPLLPQASTHARALHSPVTPARVMGPPRRARLGGGALR